MSFFDHRALEDRSAQGERTSAARFKDSGKLVPEIGRELGVELALAHEQLGHFPEAIALRKEAVELSDGHSLYRAALGFSYRLARMREQALEILKELRQDPPAAAFDVAIVHLGLDDYEQAINWLEKSNEARESQLICVKRGPRFDPLRNEPRFIRLLNRIDWPTPDEPLPASG